MFNQKKLLILLAAGVSIVLGMLIMFSIVAILLASTAAPFVKAANAVTDAVNTVGGWFSFLGGSDVRKQLSDYANNVNVGNGNTSIHDLLVKQLDCTVVPPSQAQAGICIQPEFADQQSPIPVDKLWMVPVWQAAQKKYGVPWEVLAAVSAARTDFGNRDCSSSKAYPGDGFYRIDPGAWSRYAVAGKAVGHAGLVQGNDQGSNCYTTSEPVTTAADNTTNVYDAVDSTYALAAALKKTNAELSDWNGDQNGAFDGGQNCTLAPQDGFIYRYSPYDQGGTAGFNKAINIPNDIKQLALRYTYADYSKPIFPSSGGSIPGENDPRTIPSAAENQIIVAVGTALGVSPKLLAKITPGLLATAIGESGLHPAEMQGTLNDGNDKYPQRARGLFQMVGTFVSKDGSTSPGTFWTARVPGYDNIFNPLHNTLSAMNLMQHSSNGTYTFAPIRQAGVWTTGAGWVPHMDNNPYAGIDPGTQNVAQESKKLFVAAQGDQTSTALMGLSDGKDYSGCYVSIVHDWYEAIVLDPPLVAGASGRLGLAVQVAEAELAKGVHEVPDRCNSGDPSDSNSMQINLYELSVGENPLIPTCDSTGKIRPWCAAFVSWVMQRAGVQPITMPTINQGRGSAAVGQFEDFAVANSINRPPGSFIPSPGDLVLFDDNAGHIGLVVSRQSDQTFTTIEGNFGDKVGTETIGTNRGAEAAAGVSGFVDLTAKYGNVLTGVAGNGNTKGTTTPGASPGAGGAQPPVSSFAQPPITQDFIPFGSKRQAETASYIQRHNGISTWQDPSPKVIVWHYTAGTTYASAHATFIPDVPDSELHELPGTCAQFVVDKDGTIYQQVPITTICRHTTGLNYTSIGIEMVGMSAADVLGDPAQEQSVMKLTLWLMHTYGIQLQNVIGHNESLTSPLRHELTTGVFKCQTHQDWTRDEAMTLRADMIKLAQAIDPSQKFGPQTGSAALPPC